MTWKEAFGEYVRLHVAAERQQLQQEATKLHLLTAFKFLNATHEVILNNPTMRESILFRLIKEYIDNFFTHLKAEPEFEQVRALEIADGQFLTAEKVVAAQDPEYATFGPHEILTMERVKEILNS